MGFTPAGIGFISRLHCRQTPGVKPLLPPKTIGDGIQHRDKYTLFSNTGLFHKLSTDRETLPVQSPEVFWYRPGKNARYVPSLPPPADAFSCEIRSFCFAVQKGLVTFVPIEKSLPIGFACRFASASFFQKIGTQPRFFVLEILLTFTTYNRKKK